MKQPMDSRTRFPAADYAVESLSTLFFGVQYAQRVWDHSNSAGIPWRYVAYRIVKAIRSTRRLFDFVCGTGLAGIVTVTYQADLPVLLLPVSMLIIMAFNVEGLLLIASPRRDIYYEED